MLKLINCLHSIGEAAGKTCRVPYLKGGFQVEGMPPGVEFRKPYYYGALQRQKIMSNATNIKFVLTAGGGKNTSSTRTNEPRRETGDCTLNALNSVLAKVTGDVCVAKRAIGDTSKPIKEEEVEVIGLKLSLEDRTVLYSSCQQYFTKDAWEAVGKNMEHVNAPTNLIVPILTDSADEQFWLFHAVINPAKLMKITDGKKTLTGHWLDIQDIASREYSYLPEQDHVFFCNIICSSHGPLYFECPTNFIQDPSQKYTLCDRIKKMILSILSRDKAV